MDARTDRAETTALNAAQALDDLAEDYTTGWVPDVGGYVDAGLYALGRAPGQGPAVQWLEIPKPDGTAMTVPVLHAGWHVALHLATSRLRDAVAAALAPSVYGYRRGAQAVPYASEWQRFSEHCHEKSQHSGVVIADIKSFFYQTNWPSVVDVLDRLAGEEAVTPLAELVVRFELAGLSYLPAGYGDARLLANALLSTVDSRLPCPFARWVDDYRLFTDDPEPALDALREGLLDLGLYLNPEKTRIIPRAEAATAFVNPVGSFYHPEDGPEAVRQGLLAAFAQAQHDPLSERRLLRFTLARLEHERLDVAIPFACRSLTTLPWEAPRLVSYLAVFADSHRDEIAQALSQALTERPTDGWLVARLGALALHTGVDHRALDALQSFLSFLKGSPGFGMALRLLARDGREAVFTDDVLADPRAALVALKDLDRHSSQLEELEPVVAEALAAGPAPLPALKSRL